MAEGKYIVVLDPGHYGNYNLGVSGLYYESVAMLKLSRLIRDKLNATGKIDCSLTRDDANDISLYNRGKIASDRGAFIFVSEHTDAGVPTAKGTTAFYSVDLLSDKVWASKFSYKISQALGTSDRGAKYRMSENYPGEDYYGVIDSAQDNGIPHVFIVENAFHSNVEDEAKLRQDVYLNKVAIAQCEVICEMCGFAFSTPPKYYIETGSFNSLSATQSTLDKYFTSKGLWASIKYFVKSGTFNYVEQVDSIVNQMKANGLWAETIQSDGKFIVSTGSFNSEGEAKTCIDKYFTSKGLWASVKYYMVSGTFNESSPAQSIVNEMSNDGLWSRVVEVK